MENFYSYFSNLNSNEMNNEELCHNKYPKWSDRDNRFIVFYLSTIEEVEERILSEIKESFQYSNYVVFHRTQIDILRASSISFRKGYPMPAFSLSRNVYKKNILISGVFQGFTTFEKLWGNYTREDERVNFINAACTRDREEKKVMKKMFEFLNNLTQEEKNNFEIWKKLKDWEIHGSILSTNLHLNCIYNNDSSIEVFDTLFIDTLTAISWMALRLLPLLQTDLYKFSNNWKNTWKELDAQFRSAYFNPIDNSQKPTGKIIFSIINKHFFFNEESTFKLYSKND